MKLTPEQKAFYEYGRAVESLKGTIYKIRKNAIHEFGEPYRRLMMHEQKCLINAMGLASKIHVVRQKRAACRAWKLLAQRHCLNCLYSETPANAAPCAYCTLGDLTEDFWLVCNWKPRKEASND